MEPTIDTLCAMPLHTMLRVRDARVYRVPGGWVYIYLIGNCSLIFIPDPTRDTER